jgi:hypothetical protein
MRFLLVLALLTVPAGSAFAQDDGRITFLGKQIQKSTDARVRAQAAILLGSTEEGSAVAPLCLGLEDPSEVVRLAAARALGSLQEPSSWDCLRRKTSDPSVNVREALKKALAAVEAAKNRKPEFYIQILPVQDKSARLGDELVRYTEERLKAKLEKMGSMFAPPRESKAAAKLVIKSKRLKGYVLKIELDEAPSGGLRMQVVCFTYPEQSLLGQVQVKASGGKAADLIRALAPKAIEEAASTFDWRS